MSLKLGGWDFDKRRGMHGYFVVAEHLRLKAGSHCLGQTPSHIRKSHCWIVLEKKLVYDKRESIRLNEIGLLSRSRRENELVPFLYGS
jgi:hypothetical protein